MSVYERMLQLASQGFACSQIMMQLVLDAEEKEDSDLIRTAGAFIDGMHGLGLTCGALTGGFCIIAYYAGNGEPYEQGSPNHDAMVKQLYDWFVEEVGTCYGGITCPDLLDQGSRAKLEVCPAVVEKTFNKALEILDQHDLLY